MDGSESTRRELQRLAGEVRWLTEHARAADPAPRDLVARCTIFAATLAVLLAYCLPWGRVGEDGSYSPADALRLSGWQLVDYWVDDVESGLGTFIARYVVITVVLAAIAGLCLLVPMPRVVGLALSVLLWLLTVGLAATIMTDTERLEFAFELTAWVAVIVTGALASSWTWWTAITEAGWWSPTKD
ncbi:hypothetical protein [Actinophytocola sp.]|uniref:hypothetical protein n=1 Tax=Actinophytocola sp. TaxID=1872138 RepID=UPI003D6C5A74